MRTLFVSQSAYCLVSQSAHCLLVSLRILFISQSAHSVNQYAHSVC